MKADLHVHSTYSDGASSVLEVMSLAKQNGVTHISFVDHDTVQGLEEIRRQGDIHGIEVIPGIEISAYDFKRNRKVHVLGYNYHPDAVNIKALCEPILERRNKHSLWQIEQIRAAGYMLETQEIMESAKPSMAVYKQHIMQHLTKESFSSEKYQTLYKQLFKQKGVAAGDIKYVDVFDAVNAIVADGGLAVVAHPGQLDSYDIIPELVDIGLSGIERNHMDHDLEDMQRVESLAIKYRLFMTGGTDYHGSFGTAISIGDITSPDMQMFCEYKLS
ncbi:PHP domain-containing protein [Oceanobacillus rekensis]|uniref:PHP domain-containing protein n=1 Tax=Oceanobacillus rekensis TaxID=937927 RepID=UPI000B440302|nr:PHP domain-containing protein [Oceanobacillus rekensis]